MPLSPLARQMLRHRISVFVLLGLSLACRGEKPAPVLPPPPPPQAQEYTTARAQYGNYQLDDGTAIIMAPESRLSFLNDTAASTRTAEVDGQIHFIVAPDGSHARRPFVVRIGTVTARTLTDAAEFAVRRYPEQQATQVIVAKGTVVVDTTATDTVLASTASNTVTDSARIVRAGQVARIVPGRTLVIRTPSDVSALLAWTDGTLHYEDVVFTDIVPELERMYDIEIVIRDPIVARERISADLETGSFTRMITSLLPALDATYTANGRTVELSHDPRPGRPAKPPPHRHDH